MPAAPAAKPAVRNARRLRRPLNLRERNLLAAAAWVLAILAAFACVQKFRENAAELAAIEDDIAKQTPTLELKASGFARLSDHTRRLETVRNLDSTGLQTLVDGYLRAIRINPETNRVSVKIGDGIEVLTVNLKFRAATMDRLLLFEDKLRASHIPLSVRRTNLVANLDGSVVIDYTIAAYRMAAKPAAAGTAGNNAKPAAPSAPRNRARGNQPA